jgi:predicted hotdog family 3-hydroxylacyl-ACP dehydratase
VSEPLVLEDLIPHRGRMKLVEEIVEIDDDHCVTRARVSESWPLAEEGQVSAIALIEVVAQTASAAAGWKHRDDGRLGGRGYLVGIKRACWSTPSVPVGTVLTTTVENPVRTKSYGVFVGRVESESGVIAEVHVQAVRP